MFEKARTEMVKDNATKRELTKDTKINLKQVLDAGKPEGTVSHRKNGDFIKQGGEWKPYKAARKENNTKNQALKSSADKISKRSGGKFKLTENKDPAKKGKYELKIGNKSYMVNSTEEAENFVDGYMEIKERNSLPHPDIIRAAGYSLRGSGTNPKSRGGEYKIYKRSFDGIPEEIRYDETGYDERAKGKRFSAMESGPGGRRRFFNSFREADEWIRNTRGN